MERKHALIFSLLITLLIISNYFLFSKLLVEKYEQVTIGRVIDGDTIELTDSRIVRLANINAPEKSLESHKLSLNYLKKYEGKSVYIEPLGTDKYQRLLARIYTLPRTSLAKPMRNGQEYINLELVNLGLASKFLVESSELSNFNKAEKNAVSKSLGIWNHSKYYGCLKTEIDKKSEIVIITNNCEANMAGWTLKDESRKIFTFPNISFKKITLHSSDGKNNNTDLFWNSKQNIWNNDRDSIYLFDLNGGIVHYESYGY